MIYLHTNGSNGFLYMHTKENGGLFLHTLTETVVYLHTKGNGGLSIIYVH